MTISSTTVKNSYSGNGTLDTFNYTFKVFANTDLQVIIRDASAIETVKTLTTHYTVTGAGNANGGTIVFTTGNIPSNTETVVIRRASPQTQAIDYIANDPFPAESHEEGLDRSMMAIQQLQEEIDRSIKLSRTNTMTSTEFTVGDTDRANKVFGFDANGELTVAQELGTFKGNWSSGTTYAVRDLVKDTSTNNIFIALTAHTSSGSQPLTTNTDSAKWGLLVDAATATTSSTSAASSATAAANSASSAATSATNASASAVAADNSRALAGLSAVGAGTHATNASNSATASANSASAAAATFDLFDDAFLGAKSSNPSVDNDGNALQDGALYFDTTNDVMKVYNLSSTTWLQLTPTVTNQNNINSAVANASNINAAVANESNINAAVSNASNINSVVSNASNINSVAGISTAITNVNNNSSNINAVNANSVNINAVNSNSANINSVAGNSTNINAVAGDASDIGTVATDLTGSNNIGTVSGSIANVNNVGGSIASVNTAASNLTSINSFANTYLGASSSAPTQDPDGSALDLGDLYFDTGSNQLKVYSSTGWVNAGSSVNGTSERFKYTISGTPTTVSGNDDNSNSLTYDAGFIDVFLNGIKMVNGTDVTVTSGNSVVFASALTNGDVVDIITFGTFNIASMNASNLTSGTVPDARITGAYTGITNLTMTGDLVTGGNISTGNNGSLFILDNVGQKSGQITNDGSSSNSLQIDADPDNSGADTYMQFKIDDSEKLRITSAGKVGIGTSSPASELEIESATPEIRIDATSGAGRNYKVHSDGNELYIEGIGSSGSLKIGEDGNYGVNIDLGSGTVGIGETSPLGLLHVKSADSGASANSGHNQVIAENSGNSGMTILSGNTSNGAICFGDSGNNCIGYINYTHNGDHLDFGVNGNEKMRIDSSGNFMVGKTATGIGSAGAEFKSDGRLIATVSGNYSALLNRLSSDGDIVQFRKDGTSVGSIGSASSKLHIASTGNSGIRFRDDLNCITPCNSDGSNSDADQDLGEQGVRFRRLYLSDGVRLGGTGSANNLDDYEEGTFTPSWSTGTSNYVSGGQQGRYTKIGNIVFFNIRISTASVTSLGTAWINGLPFTSANISNYFQSAISVFPIEGYQNLGDAGIKGQISPNTTRVELYINQAGSGANYNTLDASEMDESGLMQINLGGFYHV